MLRRLWPIVAGLTLLLAPVGFAWARTTVAVAPFATGSGEEYQWIGHALASALSLRVYQQPELNGLTGRQVYAAMREDNRTGAELVEPGAAIKLGRQLGANVLVVGSYNAKWPSLELTVKVVDPQAQKVVATESVTGELDRLLEVEVYLADVVARALGASKPNAQPGAFGTESLRAWREAMLGFMVINYQSLSPQAALPNVPLTIPAESIRAAKRSFERAIAEDADYGEAWAGLGVCEALLDRTDPAWRAFGKATALGSGQQPTAVLGAAFVRMRQGRVDEAAEIFKAAIARHPGFLHARGSLAELYHREGRYQEALAVWQEYLVVAPDQPWVLARMGHTKSKMGDHVGAIADSIRAVDILSDSPSLLVELASRYIDAQKLMGAEDALRHALELFPNEPRIYVRLSYVYLLQGRDELAVPIAEKALKLAELDSHRRDRMYAHLNLARAYGHRGELDRAFEHLTKAKQDGLTSFADIDADAKLKALRADPRYRKLK